MIRVLVEVERNINSAAEDKNKIFWKTFGKYFTEKPARSCVAVKELPKNVLCEVEVIAEI